MNYLVDTNVLLRMRDKDDPRHNDCTAAADLLRHRGDQLLVCCQVLAEFWVVLTRPQDVNGAGVAFDDAVTAIGKTRASFRCLAEPEDMADRWQQVVIDNKTMGRQAHDARLVALMQAHGITHILTFNGSDFARYEGITPISPAETVGA